MSDNLELPKINSNLNIVVSKGSRPQPHPQPSPRPQPPNPQPGTSSSTEDHFFSLPLWLQWLIKIVVFLLAIGSMICGVYTCKARNKYRINTMIAGCILILSGFSVILFEAPILCTCGFWEPLRRFSLSRSIWLKLFVYLVPPIFILALSHSFFAILGSIFIFIITGLYIYFYIIVPKMAGRR